jgi:Trk-type K+ transport system membrane component
MSQILMRFILGGIVVSIFALLGDLLRPKSFAGLFGAAPSVALATLSLTAAKQGASFAATEARSMIAGSIAFFVYASFVSWIMMRYKPKALWTAIGSIALWLCVAFALWYVWLE